MKQFLKKCQSNLIDARWNIGIAETDDQLTDIVGHILGFFHLSSANSQSQGADQTALHCHISA